MSQNAGSDTPAAAVAARAGEAAHDLANGTAHPAMVYAMEVRRRYQEERDKRIKAEGNAQFIDLGKTGELSNKFKHFQDDPWAKSDGTQISTAVLSDGSHIKVLILGAGYGGLTFAVKLIKIGINPADLRIADIAGGFGGTWYWNRYPGLMCDVESYIYMPLLDEMDWMPKHRYAYGPELRAYANAVAAKWNLTDKALFQTEVKTMTWDETDKQWVVEMIQQPTAQEPTHLSIRSDYVITAAGLLHYPKLPDVAGLANYGGHSFHTSRWDYEYTDGSPDDPSLANLQDKTVGIIGTGATAVQSIPHLAKWAKHLYVFQRTPSAVDVREQRLTDPAWWKQETEGKPGWQQIRRENFNSFMENTSNKGAVNMVDDSWASMTSYGALTGSSAAKGVTRETVGDYIGSLHALDFPRQERIRARVDAIVEDRETAQKLKAWYPGWCKRPCFHDDYLPVFNLPTVTLVDTDGKGIQSLTEKGVVANGTEYPVDLVIFSTGFRSPSTHNESLRSNVLITGRGGQTLAQKWARGTSTLHGVTTRDFPNLFWPGPSQGCATANQSHILDIMSTHVAYIISQSEERQLGGRVVIEPTADAEERWSMEVLTRAVGLAAMHGCTPSYFNREGEADRTATTDQEEMVKAARSAIWGEGIKSFSDTLEAWRARGAMDGIEVTVV